MSDLISRKEMLRTYQELCMNIACSECSFYFGDTLTGDCLLEKWIHSLPSAEPKTPSNGSITCVKPKKMHDRTMGDLISRQDAIDAILGLTNCDTAENLRAYVIGYDLSSWWSGGVLSSIGKVERLPSAEGCKCPCEYREPCDYCHYDGHLGLGCPAEEGVKDE